MEFAAGYVKANEPKGQYSRGRGLGDGDLAQVKPGCLADVQRRITIIPTQPCVIRGGCVSLCGRIERLNPFAIVWRTAGGKVKGVAAGGGKRDRN